MIILACILCGGLIVGTLKLFFAVAWSLAKVVAAILSIVALPLLVFLAITASGIVLLLPAALAAVAFLLLRQAS